MKSTSIFVIVVCLLAFGIPSIYFSVVFQAYTSTFSQWQRGQCQVNNVVTTFDDFCVCRSLFNATITVGNHTIPSVACTSVNARQGWGRSSNSQDDVCGGIDGQPWTDGGILPAAWKCTSASKYFTAQRWTLPYASQCIYNCNSNPCIVMMDSDAPFMDWHDFYAFLQSMYCVGGIPIILSIVCLVVSTPESACYWSWRILAVCAVPWICWSASIDTPLKDSRIAFITFSVLWVLSFVIYTIYKVGKKGHTVFVVVHLLLTLAIAILAAIMAADNILYLATTLHMFVYLVVMPIVFYEPSLDSGGVYI